jgi:hypothetical protein
VTLHHGNPPVVRAAGTASLLSRARLMVITVQAWSAVVAVHAYLAAQQSTDIQRPEGEASQVYPLRAASRE